jgi:putative redox protein
MIEAEAIFLNHVRTVSGNRKPLYLAVHRRKRGGIPSGTCAGIYVLGFCRQRQIDTEDLALTERMEFTTTPDGKNRLARVSIHIDLPPGFPEKYKNAIVKTAGLCSVKKVLIDPSEFEITARLA